MYECPQFLKINLSSFGLNINHLVKKGLQAEVKQGVVKLMFEFMVKFVVLHWLAIMMFFNHFCNMSC